MKETIQENALGCGVACVASILNASYQESLVLFEDGKRKSESIGFYCSDIVSALGKSRLEYKYTHVTILPQKLEIPRTIVYIGRSFRYPAGHYLARTEDKRWMDPWINFPNTRREAGFREILPGEAEYVIYPI